MGGKSTGSKGRKGRMLTQDPSSSQLPSSSRDPPTPAPPQTSLELCRHSTGRGLAWGPGRPAPYGQDIVDGGGGNLGQTVCSYPYSRFSVSAKFASARVHRDIAFPDV